MADLRDAANAPNTSGGGLIRMATPDAVKKALDEGEERRSLDLTSPEVVGLAAYLKNIYRINKDHRENNGIDKTMLDNLRARDSKYSPEKIAAIAKAGGSDVFMGLTNMKCRHAEAWILDVMSSALKPWAMQPTPVVSPTEDLGQMVTEKAIQAVQSQIQQSGQPPPAEQIQQLMAGLKKDAETTMDHEAKARSKKMEDLIHDQMVEGGWDTAFTSFVSDLVTLKVGIIKGPVVRNAQRVQWKKDEAGGFNQKVEDFKRPEFERVSPFDFFPSPYGESVNDGDICERIQFERSDLVRLKDEEGYDAEAIEKVLEGPQVSREPLGDSDSGVQREREILEDKDNHQNTHSNELKGVEFWVSVQGKMLKDHGIKTDLDGNDLEDLNEYEINAIMVNDTPIFVEFNPDPIARRPYLVSGWTKVPGSFWFKAVPELMQDLQQICNASVRALVNNMAVASGPQAEVDIDRLAPGEDVESIFPLKIWQVQGGTNSAPAIRFFQPESNAGELFTVYENFAQLADNFTGIPAYSFGSDKVAGAGRTSSGLSMLMSASARELKQVILRIDMTIFRPVVEALFDWNMKYSEDESIKGDLSIVASGAVAIMVREQMAEKRMAFLQATANQMDFDIMGMEGRANVLREAAGSLEIEQSKVVPPEDIMRERSEAAKKQQEAAQSQEQELALQTQQMELQRLQMEIQGQQSDIEKSKMEVQLQQLKLEMEQAKMEMEQEKMQLEMQLAQAKMQIDMQNSQAKLQLEAQKLEGDQMLAEHQFALDATKSEDDGEIRRSDSEVKNAKTAADTMKVGVDTLMSASDSEDEPAEAPKKKGKTA